MVILKQKQAELAEIEAHIQLLKDNIDGKNREFKVSQIVIALYSQTSIHSPS